MKPKACRHTRMPKVRYFADIFTAATEDRAAVWCIIEVFKCAKCGDELGCYANGVSGTDERSVLKAYGVPVAELPPPPGYKSKPAVEVPLSGWPFPVSAHDEKAAQLAA